MRSYTDALRGYAYPVHKRDDFICCYCGLDGTSIFEAWLCLTEEHLLPKGHPKRNNPEFIKSACNFCNVADNRYFELLEKRGLKLEGLTPNELVKQRKKYVMATRNSYYQFWQKRVIEL